MFSIKKRMHINWIVKANSDFIWGCFSISSTFPLWIVTLCIRSFVIQLLAWFQNCCCKIVDWKVYQSATIFSFEQNKQAKSPGVFTAKGNTKTHAGIQREAHAMQFLQKGRRWPWNICILSDLLSLLVLYQREKLLSKTPCLDFTSRISSFQVISFEYQMVTGDPKIHFLLWNSTR